MDILKTFQELCDSEEICNYCYCTDYGEHKFYSTPNGCWFCEGSWCDEAYEAYLEEENTTENIVKYASLVKLTNKEDVYGQQT